MLPDGWKTTTVGQSCSIRNTLRFPLSAADRAGMQGQYPYFGPTGQLDSIDHYRIDEPFALIGEDGDHFLKFKDRPMTIYFEGKANVNNHAHIIGDSKECLAKWFYYYFMHRDLTPVLSRQGVGRYKLTKAGLEKLEIVLPPLDEQAEIIKVLSVWDQALTSAERLLINSRTQKRALMKNILQPRHAEDWHLNGWERRSLGDLCVIDRESLPSSTPGEFKFRYISLSDVGEHGISSRLAEYNYVGAPSRARRVVRDGDILFSTVRPNLMGHSYITKEFSDCVASTGFSTLTVKAGVDAHYIFQYLFSEDMKKQIDALVVGSSFPAISSSEVEDLQLNLPNENMQRRISILLRNQDAQIQCLLDTVNLLSAEQRALMSQLLNGKRRVKLPEAEVEVQE